MERFKPANSAEQLDNQPPVITDEERRAILVRAELRKQSQTFKVDLLNLKAPESTPERASKHNQTLSLVKKEADGELVQIPSETASGVLAKSSAVRERADLASETSPDLSAVLLADLAKKEQAAGVDFQNDLASAQLMDEKCANIPKLAPAGMLAGAVILGVKRRESANLNMPAETSIAQAVLKDQELLENYALVIKESEREKFLTQIPEGQRREVSAVLDSEAAKVLHASLIEKGTTEEEQRRQVRIRLFNELRGLLAKPETTDKKLAKILGRALGEMGEDSRQMFLELIRDELGDRAQGQEKAVTDHLPRIIKIMVDNFDDFRANDLIMRLAADQNINHHLAVYLFGKLVDNGYIEKAVGEWWRERQEQSTGEKELKEDKKNRLQAMQLVAGELGVVPSRAVLEFLTDDSKWAEAQLLGRVEKIKASQTEFSGANSHIELCSLLAQDETKAMMYFLLYGGQDRFNLINNYDFGKFYEMVRLIADSEFAREKGLTPLRVHEQPIQIFKKAMIAAGAGVLQAEMAVTNLRAGHFPLPNREQAYQEVSFETSESAAIKTANAEIGRVMGKEQLGAVLLFPMYREYLEQIDNDESITFLRRMAMAKTFTDRLLLIEEINGQFPDFLARAKTDLGPSWIKLGEKMVIEMTLDQVFTSETVPVRGEELLPRLDAKRIDLKRINKELLAVLRGENKAMRDIGQEISRKRRAKEGLNQGLEKQTEPEKRKELTDRIKQIEKDIVELEKRRSALGEIKVDERFASLSPAEKKEEIDRLSRELIALTEKSPSAIFTYITMQVLGEKRLTESDVALVREMESHLQGPFQAVTDLMTYDRGRSGEKKQTRVALRYLDKRDRLTTMVRFADSKICCFSSTNYEMKVQHDTPNKFWVASINADPMSFVISMELPGSGGAAEPNVREIRENVGFIFGSFGVNEGGKLAVMLNGIYYAPGIENEIQTEAILVGVEEILRGLPIKTIAVATQHGGSVKMPAGYTKESTEMTRLRAIDDGSGNPENKIYDDLNTNGDLNRPHFYGNDVWHKDLK